MSLRPQICHHPVVLFFPPLDGERLDRLGRALKGRLLLVNAANTREAGVAIRDAEAFVGKLTPELLKQAQRLRWVQSPTAGLEHYLFPELIRHDAVVTNMRGLSASPASQQVMGYILTFARNLHLYARLQAQHQWQPVGGEASRHSDATGPAHISPIDTAVRDLRGATMLIVGYGSIGRAAGRLAISHGMKILAVDPVFARRKEGAPAHKPEHRSVRTYPLSALDGLLSQAEYVVIACPETPQTRGLFNRTRLARMRRDAILINVGRGAVVELEALTAALKNHEIGGAALDVFEEEPLPSDHPLWDRDDVIITPHVAGYGPPVAERHFHVLLTNLRRFASGRPLVNVVDKEAWY